MTWKEVIENPEASNLDETLQSRKNAQKLDDTCVLIVRIF
jgi:hypothetical protein